MIDDDDAVVERKTDRVGRILLPIAFVLVMDLRSKAFTEIKIKRSTKQWVAVTILLQDRIRLVKKCNWKRLEESITTQ